MKRLLIAAIVFCGFAEVSAQTKGNLEFGINTGLNISTVRNSRIQAENGYRFNLGMSANYFFSESWSIKANCFAIKKAGIMALLQTKTVYHL